MTVQWEMSESDLKDAIIEWLSNNYGVNADGAKIKITTWLDGTNATAKITGIVEHGMSDGPYR